MQYLIKTSLIVILVLSLAGIAEASNQTGLLEPNPTLMRIGRDSKMVRPPAA